MIVVVAALVRRDGKILITRRPDHVHLGGLWEFPGGKVEGGESLTAALRREILEELGIKIEVLTQCFSTEFHYAEKSVHLHFFDCAITEGEPRAIHSTELRWVDLAELCSFSFPEADKDLIAHLQKL